MAGSNHILNVNPDDGTLIRGALIGPKPSLDNILRATGGVLPAFAFRTIRHYWKHLQHPEKRGAVLQGDSGRTLTQQIFILCFNNNFSQMFRFFQSYVFVLILDEPCTVTVSRNSASFFFCVYKPKLVFINRRKYIPCTYSELSKLPGFLQKTYKKYRL